MSKQMDGLHSFFAVNAINTVFLYANKRRTASNLNFFNHFNARYKNNHRIVHFILQ